MGNHDVDVLKDSLPSKLAAHFRGKEVDYKVALLSDSHLAVIFPNWVERGSAIGHSPLWLDGVPFTFSDWQEVGERDRGHLRHKVWLRLRNWPLACWTLSEVTAAVAGFGEVWDADERSTGLLDVSHFRVQVRCGHVEQVPESLLLMVADRRFHVPIEVDSWEETKPILLDEETDRGLGLDSWEDQEQFRRRARCPPPLPAAPDGVPDLPPARPASGGGLRVCCPSGCGPGHHLRAANSACSFRLRGLQFLGGYALDYQPPFS